MSTISINMDRCFDTDGTVKPEALQANPWLRYLVSASTPYWNAERIGKMADKQKNSALEYTIRTLDILDEKDADAVDDADYHLVRTVLCWSEVAKAGSDEDRQRWISRGYPLDIHNEASALIYADHYAVRSAGTDPVFLLIRTHGLPGQYVRGECGMEDSMALTAVAREMGRERFLRVFMLLNECVIRAVDDAIWEKVCGRIKTFGENICDGRNVSMTPEERLNALLPDLPESAADPDILNFFSDRVFPHYTLWYFQSALEPFDLRDVCRLCRLAAEAVKDLPEDRRHEAGNREVRHLNFKPLADAMYYDYQGVKHINTYKQRIIERYLEDPEAYGKHVRFLFDRRGIQLLIGVEFTPVCDKLIDFCVEAERSGLLTYENSITMLYDTFGFRRDQFDRLNNEEHYLQTMNDAAQSTKLSILDYVTGERVVDVGSGGGVLLDELEKLYPDKEIIGTDISQNVIETLERKKKEEGHGWKAIRHNFVEGPLEEKADSIIFSSIIHEIYSYTDLGNGKFDRRSVEAALENAAASLRPGGRIIIRDGVKTPGKGRMKIRFKTEEGMDFFRQFLKQFRGMDDLEETEKCAGMDTAEKSVITDINFGREFLYTYTWGAQSFAHEVQECFGYFRLDEFEELFEKLGLKMVRCDSLLEPGYKEHLEKLVALTDPDAGGAAMEFPDSNCIVAAESGGRFSRLTLSSATLTAKM